MQLIDGQRRMHLKEHLNEVGAKTEAIFTSFRTFLTGEKRKRKPKEKVETVPFLKQEVLQFAAIAVLGLAITTGSLADKPTTNSNPGNLETTKDLVVQETNNGITSQFDYINNAYVYENPNGQTVYAWLKFKTPTTQYIQIFLGTNSSNFSEAQPVEGDCVLTLYAPEGYLIYRRDLDCSATAPGSDQESELVVDRRDLAQRADSSSFGHATIAITSQNGDVITLDATGLIKSPATVDTDFSFDTTK